MTPLLGGGAGDVSRPRVLLVGLGRWGEKHLRVLAEIGAEVWAADVGDERRQYAVRAGVDRARVVADYRAALPHVDAVDIVTPADSHLALVSTCLRAGKPCFVEKPLARTVTEGHALAAEAAATGCALQVGHIFRFHPVADVLREQLAAGGLGAIRHCTGRFVGFKRPRTDVGVTRTDAIHYFDLFAHVLQRPATAVTATLRDHLGRGMDDWSVCTVEYGAVAAVVEAGCFAPQTRRDLTIVGEQATLAADFGTAEVRVYANRHVFTPGGWQASEGAVEVVKAVGPEPLRRELELFLDAAAGRGAVPVDVHAGLAALLVVEAAERSSRGGHRVMLADLA